MLRNKSLQNIVIIKGTCIHVPLYENRHSADNLFTNQRYSTLLERGSESLLVGFQIPIFSAAVTSSSRKEGWAILMVSARSQLDRPLSRAIPRLPHVDLCDGSSLWFRIKWRYGNDLSLAITRMLSQANTPFPPRMPGARPSGHRYRRYGGFQLIQGYLSVRIYFRALLMAMTLSLRQMIWVVG